MKRVGVDIGGTFTDIVVFDEVTGNIRRGKAPTTASAPEEGFLAALRRLEIEPADVSYLMHGTTLVANLVIERRGAKVGLITTRGFRDVLEIGRSYRPELYDLQWDKPRPLVPRSLRLEVDERRDHTGELIRPIDPAEVRSAVSALVSAGVEAIAVCLFNSYANPESELEIEKVVRDLAPDLPLSLSSRVDPRILEYERVSTTVLNAYATPRLRRYTERLDDALERRVDIKYMHSGGGVIPSIIARDYPSQLVFSGPAAGVLAGSFLASALSLEAVCTMDMGGTSCDVCLIRDGRPQTKDTIEVEWGIPVRTQSIDIHAIGAGGGSVASIDAGGALRVGPESTGADPGPACYDRGGNHPTVTDANLILGLLSPEGLLGGELQLNPARARSVLERLSDGLSVSVEDAAQGIYRIVNANMAQALRVLTVKAGVDPRDFVLVAFGGAGGQHAADVAREIQIRRVLFPRNASALSAFGMLTADLMNTEARTIMQPVEALPAGLLGRELQKLEQSAQRFLEGQRGEITSILVDRWADVRYIGQSHEVEVPIPHFDMPPSEVYSAFESLHEQLYGVRLGDPAEVVNLRVTVTGKVRAVPLLEHKVENPELEPRSFRQTAFFTEPLAVYDRDRLPAGWSPPGPCLIEETDSVLFLPGGDVTIDRFGSVWLDWGVK